MMKREDVLMEALPYIQQFHGKTIVIKLGGHAMVDPVVLENAIRDVVLLHYVGIRVVLVHGGGPEISEKMKAMGKESVFVGGLRVTDPETLRNLLVQQVTGRVRWRESISWLAEEGGVTRFAELGSGKVLSGMAKRIAPNAEAVALNTPQDLEAFAQSL